MTMDMGDNIHDFVSNIIMDVVFIGSQLFLALPKITLVEPTSSGTKRLTQILLISTRSTLTHNCSSDDIE